MLFSKPELLAPAGSLEKMKVALEFGADAVYFGLPEFSLRARINNFGMDELREGVAYCHSKGKKAYVTMNIFAHNRHIRELPSFLALLKEIKPDGLIISDPGVFFVAKKMLPEIPIHISTQANVTNAEAVKFWKEAGAKRIILAREVSLEEIKEISADSPDVELEAFVHGAMCMSYSGRCILSKWMTGRSANLGDCVQPCRWKYQRAEHQENEAISGGVMNIIDEKRQFEMRVEEDGHGTYLFNSFDLCMIEHLEKLANAGVCSFKIEGRAKSVYYLATVVKAYRQQIDVIYEQFEAGISIYNNKAITAEAKKRKLELTKVANRGYWSGFFFGDQPPHNLKHDSAEAEWMFCGVALEKESGNKREITVHNYLLEGDKVQVLTPSCEYEATIVSIENSSGGQLASAHGGTHVRYFVVFDRIISGAFLIRKKIQ